MGSTEITTQEQIPDAPFYVLMRDAFFSGWGRAEARDAFYIAVCASDEEAQIVVGNAKARGDQDSIQVLTARPQVHREARFSLMTRESSKPWYVKDGFKKEEEDKSYNGWTNWETWNVNCWLENDPDTYEATEALAEDEDLTGLAALAREHVGDDIDFDKVNWIELQEHYGDH